MENEQQSQLLQDYEQRLKQLEGLLVGNRYYLESDGDHQSRSVASKSQHTQPQKSFHSIDHESGYASTSLMSMSKLQADVSSQQVSTGSTQ